MEGGEGGEGGRERDDLARRASRTYDWKSGEVVIR